MRLRKTENRAERDEDERKSQGHWRKKEAAKRWHQIHSTVALAFALLVTGGGVCVAVCGGASRVSRQKRRRLSQDFVSELIRFQS